MSLFYPVEKFADWLLSFTNLSPNDTLYGALHFFIYDSIKIIFLLIVIIFLITFIRKSYLSPEKTRKMLSNRFSFVGNVFASLLGVVTPFCSCSAIALFIGLLEAGVPLGVTFSYLISAPMVNEIAVILLFGMFGWKVALLYVVSGVILAIVAGVFFGQMKLDHLLEEEYIRGFITEEENKKRSAKETLQFSYYYTKDLMENIYPYILIGVALGAGIHGYLPEGFLATYASASNPFAVIIVVLIGIPLYSNAAGTIPIVRSLVEKGLPMGTALAFMMSVTALSLPEMIILRNVLKPKLLALYFGIVGLGIIATGYMFNMIL